MKMVYLISSLLLVCPFSAAYARCADKAPPERPAPPMMPHYMMPGEGQRGRGMHMMPRRHMRLKSELQIRAALKERYDMNEADITTVLKARKEILGVIEKYRPSQEEEMLPPMPFF